MKPSFIFDMDGTLIDTESIATSCWEKAFKDLNCKFDKNGVDNIKGAGKDKSEGFFNSYFKFHPEYKAAKKQRNVYFDEEINNGEVKVLKGVIPTLNFLTENKYDIAIATSSPEPYTRKVLQRTGLIKYFSNIVFGGDVEKGKPDPDIFIYASKYLKAPKDKIYIVEDSKYGIEAAYKGGFHPIGIPNSYPFDDRIKSMCAFLFKDMEEMYLALVEGKIK